MESRIPVVDLEEKEIDEEFIRYYMNKHTKSKD